MGRFLVLGLALPLAGCDVLIDACVEATFYPDHGLEVKNAGARDVRLTVVYDVWEEGDDDEPDELVTRTDVNHLAPNEKVTVWYPDEALNVTIERVIDGQILYQDHLSGADFNREHDRIEITVYP